jgi:NAD(P)-dependent dehydrogenase (short-subunit alcohol dehydrogenase family)
MKVTRPPFNFHSTASQVVSGLTLTGKRVIVTGASSGLGIETARALASIGGEVTLAVRNLDAGRRIAAEISASTKNPQVSATFLNLADRPSIAAFTAAWKGPLTVLVNNAAVMALPDLQQTPEGWEMQFATNYLGHFELALGLHDALAAGSTDEFKSRIVSVSSSAHFLSPVIFDDLFFRYRVYEPWLAYAQSKTANVLFAVEATKRWAADGILANALTPGVIPTNLQRHVGGLNRNLDRLKTIEQGAATSCLAATCPIIEGLGGLYLADCGVATVAPERPKDYGGVAPYALDPANAERLWETGLDLLGKNVPRSFRGPLA